MLKRWREKKAKEADRLAKIEADDYLKRLNNSYNAFCGMRYENLQAGGKLSIEEIRSLMYQELKRREAV